MTRSHRSAPSRLSQSDPTMVEARRWWDIMQDDRAVADNLAAFSAWIDADPRHNAAFEQVCRQQRKAAAAPWHARFWPAAGWRRWGVAMASTAVVAGVLIASGGWQRPDVAVPAGAWENRAPGDGSALQFGPGARARMEFTRHQRLIRLSAGSVIIEAAKDAERPMIVETAHGSVRVVGTRFAVVVDATGTEVSVTRGKVEAVSSSIPAAAAPVTAAQRVRLSADGITRHASPIPDTEEIRNGWRTLSSVPLADLASAVEAETGRTVVVLPTASARAQRLSGRFFVRDGTATLALLESAYGVRHAAAPFGVTLLY